MPELESLFLGKSGKMSILLMDPKDTEKISNLQPLQIWEDFVKNHKTFTQKYDKLSKKN